MSARFPKGVCSECNRVRMVRHDGMIRFHHNDQGEDCYGSDRPPSSVLAMANGYTIAAINVIEAATALTKHWDEFGYDNDNVQVSELYSTLEEYWGKIKRPVKQ